MKGLLEISASQNQSLGLETSCVCGMQLHEAANMGHKSVRTIYVYPLPQVARFIGGSVHQIGILGASLGSFEKKEVIFPLLASISTRERSHTLRTCALIMRQKKRLIAFLAS